MLTIAEELFLLALNHKRGWMYFKSSVSMSPALAGGMLFDLAIDDVICVTDKKVLLESKQSFDVKIISDAIKELSFVKREKSIKHWVRKFSARKYDLKEKVIDELESRGLIKRKEIIIAKYLPIKRLVLKDKEIKTKIIDKLNKSFREQNFKDPRVASLFVLVVSCGLEKVVFGKGNAHEAKETARWLQMDDQIAEAVREIVDELTVLLYVANTASSAS